MLSLIPSNRAPLRVLCLGAHCDDIEIGCGGTLLTLAATERQIEIYWFVFTSDERRKQEALKSAAVFLEKIPRRTVLVDSYRDGFLPYVGSAIKDRFEQLKSEFVPDLILTHYERDLHQDHRLISELTWNTFRDHLILEYEIPKYDGDFGSPNVLVSLSRPVVDKKIETVLGAFGSQSNKHWFSGEVFLSVMRLRGMEANAPSTYAEGFYCRKLVLEVR
jgi:LmbE family N-acetylglucosaminyl deacetylase